MHRRAVHTSNSLFALHLYTIFRLIVVIAFFALCATPSFAQSGRKQATPTPAPTPNSDNAPKRVEPPVPGFDTPEAPPPPKHHISSLVAAGDIIHDAAYFYSSLVSSSLKEFVSAMKSEPRPFLSVDKASKMTLDEARARAKNETHSHVIWLGFITRNDAMGQMYLLHIDFSVVVPRTGHVLFSGRIISGQQQVVGQGGVMTIPRTVRRRSLNLDMKQAAREVTYRLKTTGWLCYKTPC